MFIAPFGFGLICAFIIARSLGVCKCAICISFCDLQITNGAFDLSQAHFRNIADSRTVKRNRIYGIEKEDRVEMLVIEIFSLRQPTTGKQHILCASLQRLAEYDLKPLAVQIGKIPLIGPFGKLGEIILHIIFHKVFRGGNERVTEIGFIFKLAEAVLQRRDDVAVETLLRLP